MYRNGTFAPTDAVRKSGERKKDRKIRRGAFFLYLVAALMLSHKDSIIDHFE